MRRAMLIGTVVMGIVGLAGSAWGVVAQPVEKRVPAAHEFRDPTNAALVYWQTFIAFAPETSQKLTEKYAGDAFWRPDTETVKLVAEEHTQETIAQVIRASKIRDVDWGIEWSRGCYAMLSHLGKLRGMSRVLAVDARRLIAEGKVDDAAERCAAIFRVSTHASPDGTLISSLVGAAINGMACAEAEALLADGRLSAKGKREILEAAAWTEEKDPFHMRGALGGERRWTSVWLREKCRGAEAGKKAAELLKDLTVEADGNAEVLKRLEKLDEAGLDAELDKLDGYFAAAVAAWDGPAAEAKERLATLERSADEQKYGMLFKLLGPSVMKVYESEQKARAKMQDVLGRVRAFVPVEK